MCKYIRVFAHCSFDINSFFKLSFNCDQIFNTIDHFLHQFDFSETNSLVVWDVPFTAWTCWGVFAVSTTCLHSLPLCKVLELVWGQCIGQFREEDHGWSPQACAQVGWAGVDLAEVVVELLAWALVLQDGSDLLYPSWPPVEDVYDVSTFVHRDDSHVIFFVHPHEEFAIFSTKDTSVIRPVSACSCCC